MNDWLVCLRKQCKILWVPNEMFTGWVQYFMETPLDEPLFNVSFMLALFLFFIILTIMSIELLCYFCKIFDFNDIDFVLMNIFTKRSIFSDILYLYDTSMKV